MDLLANSIDVLLPYEFSPAVLVMCGGAAWLYVRGRATGRAEHGRAVLFWLGLGLIYVMLQTRYDFYALHMFFLHRLQHLTLHHLAPFFIALARPGERLLAGLPVVLRQPVIALGRGALLRRVSAAIQQPLVASVLFVGLIYFWLIPDIHFLAMLNLPLYNTMNWGMALDGLLFWWMVFNMRGEDSSAARHFGGRLLLLFLVMLPQIAIGAHIAFSDQELFDVYGVCGRAWPISEQLDQQLGGLITWIPASMMSIAGGWILLQRWMHQEPIAEGATCREPS